MMKRMMISLFFIFLLGCSNNFPVLSKFEIEKYRTSIAPVFSIRSESISLGTGFLVDKEKGYVVTCAHVVRGKKSINILNVFNKKYFMNIKYINEKDDLAILEIQNKTILKKMNALKFESKDNIKTTDRVLVIGNPRHMFYTYTSGIISNILDDKYILSDAVATFGSSGSPIINKNGKVVGIVNMKAPVEGCFLGLSSWFIQDVLDKL